MLGLLDALFLQPLMLIYATVFAALPEAIGAGFRIVLFSILINLVLLPIYAQMEQRSAAARIVKRRVAAEVARMKKHFKGRERYFYIRAVYRQHGYHPSSELFGSSDLFVQILVFATVFRFLSGLDALSGQSFGPIADLAREDGLLGGVNLLPFVMTAINALAVFAYVDDRGKRIQAVGLAILFLVLLYRSPSGLVLYWTMNNLISLVRTIAMRRIQAGIGATSRYDEWRRLVGQQ